MTKQRKSDILQQADMISQAIDAALVMGESNLLTELSNLLMQMQQLTIQIGTTIEKCEKDGHPIVEKLEELCELIYQTELTCSDKENFWNFCARMKRLIKQIINDIRYHVQVQLEIVFLPYQASMWDSLESIWMAASKDPKAACYVAPIPFYDVLADGSLGALHYEGDRYPKYVPVTSYKEYDIQERKPDIIFIHNPYDDFNNVTRIPERYYTGQLKQSTKMLVYVPYFLSDLNGPADHQCYTPGVLLSDRVVVQPGSIYRKYCRIYTSVLKENGWDKKLVCAEKKFLPLGSPKIDKILNTSCDWKDIPQQWKDVILKPDGSRKKIVLYNLSIAVLLAYSDSILSKIDYVFHRFQCRQEDVILLLRPHPLLMNTINTMRPELRDEFLKRVEALKNGSWGIFDDTPDPNTAMAISDAYYGDGDSSLLVSYQALGKPMLMQSIFKNRDSVTSVHPNKMLLMFAGKAVAKGDDIWFVSRATNGLYRYSLLSERAFLEAEFTEETKYRNLSYCDIAQYENKLIFTPAHVPKIAVYDTSAKTMHDYMLPHDLEHSIYEFIIIHKSDAYFIGQNSDVEILKMNLETEELFKSGYVPDQALGENLAEKIGHCASLNDWLYVPIKTKNKIVAYNLETSEHGNYSFDVEENEELQGIFAKENKELLICTKHVIYTWDVQKKVYNALVHIPEAEINYLVVEEQIIYIYVLLAQKVYAFDRMHGLLKEIDCKNERETECIRGRKMLPIETKNGTVMFFSLFNKKIYFLQDGKIVKKAAVVSEQIPAMDYEDYYCNYTKTEGDCYQTDLENYLEFVIRRKSKKKFEKLNSIGEKVYLSIRNDTYVGNEKA